jgi:hypothetical protein
VLKLINYICINKLLIMDLKPIFLQCHVTEQEELQQINVVKKFLGIKNNSELIRLLIKKEYENIK